MKIISVKPGVAIIGAGISGLSCAHELERFGCRPVIFEISRSVGHPFAHCGAVLGDFDVCTLYMWLNETYAGKGWAYLFPYNSRRASLVLSVPNVRPDEMQSWWNKFFQTEGFDFIVTETFQATLAAGFVRPCRVGKVFLVGVAGGFIDPLLGMGVLPGVASGVLAARSIVRGLDYEKETAFWVELIKKADDLRRTLNKLSNAGMDHLVGLLGLPLVRALVYRTKLDVVELAELLLKMFQKTASAIPRAAPSDVSGVKSQFPL